MVQLGADRGIEDRGVRGAIDHVGRDPEHQRAALVGDRHRGAHARRVDEGAVAVARAQTRERVGEVLAARGRRDVAHPLGADPDRELALARGRGGEGPALLEAVPGVAQGLDDRAALQEDRAVFGAALRHLRVAGHAASSDPLGAGGERRGGLDAARGRDERGRRGVRVATGREQGLARGVVRGEERDGVPFELDPVGLGAGHEVPVVREERRAGPLDRRGHVEGGRGGVREGTVRRRGGDRGRGARAAERIEQGRAGPTGLFGAAEQ